LPSAGLAPPARQRTRRCGRGRSVSGVPRSWFHTRSSPPPHTVSIDAKFSGKDPGFFVLRVSLQCLTDTRQMHVGVPLYREHEVLVRRVAVPAAAIMWCNLHARPPPTAPTAKSSAPRPVRQNTIHNNRLAYGCTSRLRG